ncbi:unnamed protein product [Cochlearia groenlandica]
MDSAVWKGLVDNWRDPHATQVAWSCSKSRITDQHGAILTYIGSDILCRTSNSNDGTFVNPRIEQFANPHDAIAAERLSQMSTSSSLVDRATFGCRVAPKKKNHYFGVDYIDEIPAASYSGPRSTPSTAETDRLRQELAEARYEIATMQINDTQR